MAGKSSTKAGALSSGIGAARRQPAAKAANAAKAAPRKRAPRAASAATPVAPEAVPEAQANGARALIRAGLKALGDVRGDMVARQSRIFELLLGIGQAPGWSTPPKPEQATPPDPFGKFEDVFDQRVARSLERLGIPSPAQLQELSDRVDALTALLHQAQAPAKPRRR